MRRWYLPSHPGFIMHGLLPRTAPPAMSARARLTDLKYWIYGRLPGPIRIADRSFRKPHRVKTRLSALVLLLLLGGGLFDRHVVKFFRIKDIPAFEALHVFRVLLAGNDSNPWVFAGGNHFYREKLGFSISCRKL